MSFYKTSEPDVIAAVNKFFNDYNDLRDHAEAFAERFGVGTLVFCQSVSGTQLYGVKFSEKLDDRFWTKPDKKVGTQSPRKTVKGTTDEKASQKALYALWHKLYPSEEASRIGIYDALGVSWGDLLFTPMSWFLHNGIFYADTFLPIKATEILGSEYKVAKQERQNE